jgi:hypothetical protein
MQAELGVRGLGECEHQVGVVAWVEAGHHLPVTLTRFRNSTVRPDQHDRVLAAPHELVGNAADEKLADGAGGVGGHHHDVAWLAIEKLKQSPSRRKADKDLPLHGAPDDPGGGPVEELLGVEYIVSVRDDHDQRELRAWLRQGDSNRKRPFGVGPPV